MPRSTEPPRRWWSGPQRDLLTVLLAAGFVAVLVAGVGLAIDHTGPTDVLDNVVLNLAATTIALLLTYLLFLVRYRAAWLQRIIDRLQVDPSGGGLAGGGRQPTSGVDLSRPALAASLVRMIRYRTTRGVIIVAEPGTGRSAFLASVSRQLAGRRKLPLMIEATRLPTGGTLVDVAKQQLQELLVDDERSPQDGDRLWSMLLRRRRLFVLIDDLDAFAVSRSTRNRRRHLSRLLDELHRRRIPFVTSLPDDLVTPLPDVALFRLPALRPDQLDTHVQQRLRQEGLWNGEDPPPRLPARGPQATSSLYLLDLSVEYARCADRDRRRALQRLTDSYDQPRDLVRRLIWMGGIAQVDWTKRPTDTLTPTQLCLSRLGRSLLLLGSHDVPWDSLLAGLSADQRDAMLLGRMTLERRDVIDVSVDGGVTTASVTHPVWLGFVAGLGVALDEAPVWRALVEENLSDPVLDALAIAVRRASVGGRPLTMTEALRESGLHGVAATELLVVTAVLDGLLAGDVDDLDREELDLVHAAWQEADWHRRIRFLEVADLSRLPSLVRQLWEELCHADRTANEYRVRREIARGIAVAGDESWRVLGSVWSTLLDQAAAVDLSARARRHSEHLWSAVTHLGWILPALVQHCETHRAEAMALAQRLARVVREPGAENRGAAGRPPDVGLEIAYFEGLKIAAAGVWSAQWGASAELRTLLTEAAERARSWLSKLAFVHAVTLVVAGDEREGSATLRGHVEVFAHPEEHPFVRQAATLALEALDLSDSGQDAVFRRVWLDDAETLVLGGAELSGAAHGLLAMSTLVTNLAEERGRTGHRPSGPPGDDGDRAREETLLARQLPRCVAVGVAAWARPGVTCSCGLRLCDMEVGGEPGFRRPSSGFLYRARFTAPQATRYVHRNPLRRVVFEVRSGGLFATMEKAASRAEAAELALLRPRPSVVVGNEADPRAAPGRRRRLPDAPGVRRTVRRLVSRIPAGRGRSPR